MTADEKFMKAAIRQAKKAEALGDVPIGCVIVYEGKVIARGYNRRMADRTVLAHAEILAIRKAGLPKIELKAVVTPTNAQWPFYKLYEEIREERRQVLEQAGKRREAREDHGETV